MTGSLHWSGPIDINSVLAGLQKKDIVPRIWKRDHTVWKPDPKEISDRLGWLDVMDFTCEHAPELKTFADEMRQAGFRQVVLLGMGGSSLGAEVLRQTFGRAPGYPELMVLDSAVPAWVLSVTRSIDLRHTLFIVSSKSGGTVEVLSLYRYFRYLADKALGQEAGQSFIAITDPGTSLVKLARAADFRRVFLNPPDIGGRYSVLSYFGMVPAALAGIDITRLLEPAGAMRERCRVATPTDNPGAWLGAVIGAFHQHGRDKLTLLTSPSLASFGLWLEQLLAESTGKEGRGIVPVVNEPMLSPEYYGDDRLFVYLCREGDNNSAADDTVAKLKSAGQPVVELKMSSLEDIGAEFFRWEFATAVAGAILEINPFDQPDVQSAKDATGRLLKEYRQSKHLPFVSAETSLKDLLGGAKPGDYFAVMAYLDNTTQADRALAEMRRKVMMKCRLATTAAYGPRFLHSTGQLHKGGPNKGIFLQITADHEQDLPVPGEPYTFGVLADAEALGDFQALQSLGRRLARLHLSAGGSGI